MVDNPEAVQIIRKPDGTIRQIFDTRAMVLKIDRDDRDPKVVVSTPDIVTKIMLLWGKDFQTFFEKANKSAVGLSGLTPGHRLIKNPFHVIAPPEEVSFAFGFYNVESGMGPWYFEIVTPDGANGTMSTEITVVGRMGVIIQRRADGSTMQISLAGDNKLDGVFSPNGDISTQLQCIARMFAFESELDCFIFQAAFELEADFVNSFYKQFAHQLNAILHEAGDRFELIQSPDPNSWVRCSPSDRTPWVEICSPVSRLSRSDQTMVRTRITQNNGSVIIAQSISDNVVGPEAHVEGTFSERELLVIRSFIADRLER